MKTIKLLVSLVLLTIVSNIYADNLAVEDFTMAPGETKNISIELNNPDRSYTMVEFWMSLPEGISIPLIGEGDEAYYQAEGNSSRFARNHVLEVNKQDGLYHFLIFSGRNEALKGDSGELVSVTIEAASDAQTGTYTATISNQLYNDLDKIEYFPDDVTFNITIEENDGYIHFSETDTSLPYYTAGEKGNVKMARTINANEWSTIVLPFTLTKSKAETIFGSDVKLAEFTGFETVYDENDEDDVTPDAITLKFTTYTMNARNKPMVGGNLYLIKTSQPIDSIVADDVTLTNTVAEVSVTDDFETPGKFTGSLVKTVVPADGIFLSGNKFWYSTGKTNIKAFRGWFELDAVLNKETDFGANIGFVVDDEPTSVDGIPTIMKWAKGAVYTVQGQYVGSNINVKNLPSGIYIVDGKKLVIK